MRTFLVAALTIALSPLAAQAQDADPMRDDVEEPPAVGVLSADQRAQLSLGGFRDYLERLREEDESLYRLLDPRLDGLEERNVIADVVFWTGTILAVGALVSAIPVHEEVGLDPALGLIVGGASTFLLAVIIQAFVRPNHDDLMRLIDLHDEQLGRR